MMLGLKQKIDTFFNDSWTETPIHFNGADFTNNTDRYIKLSCVPIQILTTSVDSLCKREEMLIEIYCYGDNLNDTMYLGDEVATLLGNATTFDLRSTVNGEAIALDQHLYTYRLSVVAYSESVLQAVFPLVDSNGNFLIDSNSNQLVG